MNDPQTFCDVVREAAKHEPHQPSADTIQAVRELYRDDRDAMAQAILSLRADLAEARRER